MAAIVEDGFVQSMANPSSIASVDSSSVGRVLAEVRRDLSLHRFGGSLSLNRRWDIIVEVGSNFDDADEEPELRMLIELDWERVISDFVTWVSRLLQT